MEHHKMFPGAFILAVVLRAAMGFDFGLSTKCVAIPKEMAVCHDISYSEMRLPNLMGHTNLAEAIPRFAKWKRLMQTGCHPDARTFFCSLLAPICLDRFIHPCRSMCVAVQESCAPVLRCQGHPWPSSLNCDRFPSDEDSCLVSLSEEYKPPLTGFLKPTCQTCPPVEEFFRHKRVLQSFCDKGFAVKVKFSRKTSVFSLQEYHIDCQVEVINQEGMLLPYEACSAIEQWFRINDNCTEEMLHTHYLMAYLIVATTDDSSIFVSHIYRWQTWNSELTLAMRKWIHRNCM
nr:secreted frizzled-related protein 2-like [Pogona vitticeps]